jgi:mannose-6-phosphate isomerase-like protein (cupin superfamily)
MNPSVRARPKATAICGIEHSTWACSKEGLSQPSVWRQTLPPGAALPPHRYECDKLMCLAGQGGVHSQGRVQRFGADATLAQPGDQLHQLFNVSDEPLQLLAVLVAAPAHTELPDRQAIGLPWRT